MVLDLNKYVILDPWYRRHDFWLGTLCIAVIGASIVVCILFYKQPSKVIAPTTIVVPTAAELLRARMDRELKVAATIPLDEEKVEMLVQQLRKTASTSVATSTSTTVKSAAKKASVK